MNINIKTKDMDLSEALSEKVYQKVGSLEKFINPQGDQEILAEVEIGLRNKHHKKGEIYRAEINLNTGGKQLRAVSKSFDLYQAIDESASEMERRIVSSRGKEETLFRRGAAQAKALLKRLRGIK